MKRSGPLLCLLLALAAPLDARPSLKDCRALYKPQYEKEAGIAFDEWDGACRSGYDMDIYLATRRDEALQRSLFVVQEVLRTPDDQLSPEAIQAFLAVDPERLPPKIRAAYKERRPVLAYRVRASAAGGAEAADLDDVRAEAPPPTQRCPQRKAALYRTMGWDELTTDENRHLLKETRCREAQAEGEFTYCVAYDLKTVDGETLKVFHAFVYPNDPLDALVVRFRAAGAQADQGTAFFGAGGGLRCK